jgi:hypothetical protein
MLVKTWLKYGNILDDTTAERGIMQTQAATDLFSSIPKRSYLGIYQDEAKYPKKVVDFLELTQSEVAKATAVSPRSVRYDSRIPEDVKRKLIEIGVIVEMVAEFFEGDIRKTHLWFITQNPLLGHIAPRDMVRYGRYKKLLKFVNDSLAGISA